MPAISLIIPVYNTEKYLRRCLDSVLAQDFTDYEVVLVDDGSSDSSPAILDEYVARDARFRVYHEQNQGSSLARKSGMGKARGEWLVFMDSDDDVSPSYLSALYDAVTANGVRVACCDMQKVRNDEAPQEEAVKPSVILGSEQLHDRFFKYDFWGFWGKIYHRDVFDGLYFSPYNINEDYVVMAQIFSRLDKVAYVPCKMYYYRTNMESQSHTKLSPRILDEYHNKKWVLNFYEMSHSRYAPRAKDQLAETCIKIYNVIGNYDKNRQYAMQKSVVRNFLRTNFWTIIFKGKLLLGLKVQVALCCYFK